MPLPTTRVITDAWATTHRAVSESAMVGACTITRGATPTTPAAYDPSTGRSTLPQRNTVYTGPCRVTATQTTSAGLVSEAARQNHPRTYLICIPGDSSQPQVNDLVTVDTSPDAAMVGAILSVVGIRRGSLAWDRVLLCEEQTPTTR